MSRLEQLRKLVLVDPADPLSHYGLALELLNLERWQEAADAFGQAIECDPNYSAAYYHQARAYQADGQAESARDVLTRGIEVAAAQGDLKTVGEMRDLLGD